MRLTPFMLTRNRSTEAFNIKHLYDFDKSTNENDHKRFLLTFLDCKYLEFMFKRYKSGKLFRNILPN